MSITKSIKRLTSLPRSKNFFQKHSSISFSRFDIRSKMLEKYFQRNHYLLNEPEWQPLLLTVFFRQECTSSSSSSSFSILFSLLFLPQTEDNRERCTLGGTSFATRRPHQGEGRSLSSSIANQHGPRTFYKRRKGRYAERKREREKRTKLICMPRVSDTVIA